MGDEVLAMIALVITSALLCKNMAQKKGYNPTFWMLFGGMLPFLSLLMILVMKRRSEGGISHGRY